MSFASLGGGGSAQRAWASALGLPFAGIPSELQAGVEKLTADEPDVPLEDVEFLHTTFDDRPLTIRRLLGSQRRGLTVAAVLVVIETLSLQAGPLLTQIGIDRGIIPRHTSIVLATALGYVGIVVLTALASSARVAWTGRVSQRVLLDLRVKVFAHQQRLSLDFYTREKAGVIMSRMTADIEILNQFFQDGLVNLAIQGLTVVIVTSVLFAMNATLALITVGIVVPVLAVMTAWYRRASAEGFLLVRDGIAAVLSDLQEGLAGVRVVAAHNRQEHNLVNHRNVVGDYRDANNHTAFMNAIYGPGTDVIGLLGQAAVLAIGGSMVLHHTLTIGELTAFLLYLTAFFAPIQTLVQFYANYQQSQAAVTKLRLLLLERPSVREHVHAVPLPPAAGEIRLDHVTFGYSPDRPVLEDVDLTIAPGETFALVGPTGAGKSTIAKLVTRFYDPDQGRVLIDGHDVREIGFDSLRRQIGVIPQEPFLFAGSLRDNIAFGRPDASEAEIRSAAEVVGLGDLVARLPEGLDTYIHERGSSLSSGERQLVALARAFAWQPRVVVLDEATSNLDLQSEEKVERALVVLLEGRTALLIAHRLSTAMRADRIALVDEGRILELGSHAELLALGGRYHALYTAWAEHGGSLRAA